MIGRLGSCHPFEIALKLNILKSLEILYNMMQMLRGLYVIEILNIFIKYIVEECSE